MTYYNIILNESLRISDSITTHEHITRTLTDSIKIQDSIITQLDITIILKEILHLISNIGVLIG